MVHVPMCDWCGEHEVGSIDGGHLLYCSDDCCDAAAGSDFDIWQEAQQDREEEHDPIERYLTHCAGDDVETSIENLGCDDGRWDDDPNPYNGTYSEE